MRSPLVGTIFDTYAKMVLINDDQCDIADIVLDVWLFLKKIITLVHTIKITSVAFVPKSVLKMDQV